MNSLGQWLLDAGKTAQGFFNGGSGSSPPPPSQPAAKSEMPAWLLPVGIGVGVILLLIFAFGGRK